MDDQRRSVLGVIRESRVLAFGVGAFSAAAGAVLIFGPERSEGTIALAAGVIVAIIGLTEGIEAVTSRRSDPGGSLLLLRGLVSLGTGAILVFWPDITLDALVWVLGIGLVAGGIVGLMAARQVPTETGRSAVVARSVIGIAFGGVLVGWPGQTIDVVITIVGGGFLLLGAYLLFSGYRVHRLAGGAGDESST
jgi:uncharacterized membrane protein HdeD (DUF308 family)